MIHLAHSPGHGAGGSDPVGSPLYDLLPGHGVALGLLMLLPLGALVARFGGATLVAWRYRRLRPVAAVLFWLLLASAAIHLGLVVVGHGGPALRVAFGAQALTLILLADRLLVGGGRWWRLATAAVLAGSILAWCVAVLAGEPPDQLGVATKLVELTALAVVARPTTAGRWRAAAATSGIALAAVAVSLSGWVGAFVAAGGVAEHQHDATHAGFAPPGTVAPAGTAGEPTQQQVLAAAQLHAQTVTALSRYADPAAAAADGYQVGEIVGTDHHASHPGYESDGRVLDPQRPETLVYAAGPRGPVLLGAMFLMPSIGEPGPTVGGPLTVWHAHENLCFSVAPPALSGLLSPLGGCPVGSVNLPLTPEMIHVWTVPGAPQAFGDLDDAWRGAYLAGLLG